MYVDASVRLRQKNDIMLKGKILLICVNGILQLKLGILLDVYAAAQQQHAGRHPTFRTWRDAGFESAMRSNADVLQSLPVAGSLVQGSGS